MNKTEPINVRPLKHLTCGEMFSIPSQRESGIATNSIANQLSTTESAVEKVSDLREALEKFQDGVTFGTI